VVNTIQPTNPKLNPNRHERNLGTGQRIPGARKFVAGISTPLRAEVGNWTGVKGALAFVGFSCFRALPTHQTQHPGKGVAVSEKKWRFVRARKNVKPVRVSRFANNSWELERF
jgi:hypothetical protein